MTDQRTAQCIIIDMVRAVWYTDDPIDESWYVGLTSCLPKKGDLSQPCNWRCIVLLEVTSKVVCNICRGRLGMHWLLHLPPAMTKNQNGFTTNRGTDDGIFTSRMLLQKARQHGMEIWCLALDFIKAFDSVDRKLLWAYLEKLGE